MTWNVDRSLAVVLSGTGEMTSSKFPWRLDINVVNSSHPVPQKIEKN